MTTKHETVIIAFYDSRKAVTLSFSAKTTDLKKIMYFTLNGIKC